MALRSRCLAALLLVTPALLHAEESTAAAVLDHEVAPEGPELQYTPEERAALLAISRADSSSFMSADGAFFGSSNYKYDSTCYAFTGGTCTVMSCSEERNATCRLGNCVCKNSCAGADGKCYQEENKVIAEGVTLTNVKWPKYKMYFKRATTFGQMSTTTSSLNLGADKFNIMQVPGENETANGTKPLFFVASQKWPSYTLAVRATTGTAVSPYGTYGVQLETKVQSWKPENVMLTVCSLDKQGYPGAIMIGSAGAKLTPIWSYVHHGSWYVYGSITHPGTGGYWKVDPPIESGLLPDC